MEIKNRWSGQVIVSGDYKTILDAIAENKNDLSGANLSGANLSDANLSGSDLSGAKLIGAKLIGANLIGANLIGANLRDANLSGADLSGSDLLGAHLIDANLSGAKHKDDTLKGYLCIGPIGSRSDYLQIFFCEKDIYCQTGCFSGTLADLESRTDRADYKAAIMLIEAMSEGTYPCDNHTEDREDEEV